MNWGRASCNFLLTCALAGCGPGLDTNCNRVYGQATLLFHSAMDVSGQMNGTASSSYNVWAVHDDGSGLQPLTRNTAAGLSSIGAAFSPDGTQIVFQSTMDTSGAVNGRAAPLNLWLMNADGSGARQLTTYGSGMGTNEGSAPNLNVLGAQFSPDGKTVVFHSTVAVNGTASSSDNLFSLDVAGGGVTPLTTNTGSGLDSFDPVFSPDGQWIVFDSAMALPSGSPTGTTNLWVVHPDGSGLRPLTRGTDPLFSAAQPSWSQDGGKIFFSSSMALSGVDTDTPVSNSGNPIINAWIMNADGSGRIAVTRNSSDVNFSSGLMQTLDSSSVVFESTMTLSGDSTQPSLSGTAYNLWKAAPDGTSPVHLTAYTSTNSRALAPHPLPDHTRIFFYSKGPLSGGDSAPSSGTRNIMIMGSDGSGRTSLTSNSGSASYDSYILSPAPVSQPWHCSP